MAQFSNVIIQGGTINSAMGDIINNWDSESGLRALSLVVSHGAIHDSAERFPPPNCHPGTRIAVRQVILEWIHNESPAFPFFWLYGSVGAGKTAILQAIAEFLCSSSGYYFGGSFFFSRGKNGRDQGHFLFSTIAYQLALRVPGLRQHLNRIMKVDPTLHTKAIDVQLQTLIVDALQSLSPLPQRSYLVIIDGLDECQDKAIQQHILLLLCKAITTCKLPLRFLIGSRPEFHIRNSFDQKALHTITRRVILDETFDPGSDIQVFLQDGFAKICAKHADILSHVEQPWPTESIIDLLVQKSSGQFIYAATVLKFVGADFCSPVKQLDLVLMPNSTAFSDLDQLYTQILSVYPSTANIVQVLGIILAFDARTLIPEVIEDILGMEEGEVKLVLRGLSSLIAFVGDENEEYLSEGDGDSNVGSVYLIHTSFRDYLVDSSRSGPFHINQCEHKNQAIIWSFALITEWIGRPWRIPSATRLPHSKTWDCFKTYLATHLLSSSEPVIDVVMTDINELMQEFWEISSGGEVAVFYSAVHCLMWILKDLADRLSIHYTIPGAPEYTENDFLGLYQKVEKMLDQSLTKSSDIGDLLRFLPGIVVQKGLTMQGMSNLYRVKMDMLDRLSRSNFEPLIKLEQSSYVLRDYLSDFLQDRDRSHHCYCNPMLHHVLICRQFLSLLDGSDASDLQCHELLEYIRSNLCQHWCATTEIFLSGESIPGGHPAVEFLNDLDRYCHFDANQSHFKSYLAAYTIRSVLRWADALNRRPKPATLPISSVELIERLAQFTDRIYRNILYMETCGSTMTITLSAPLRSVYMIPETRPCRAANRGVLQLSWDLLAHESVEDRICSFFTDFMTTPERSGPFYTSPHVYHTQVTEYSLETIFRRQNSRPSPYSPYNHTLIADWSFNEHISRALPTEMIIYLLRSIYTLFLTRDGTAESMINSLDVIIKWLEGLGSERPNDLYDRFQAAFAAETSMRVNLPSIVSWTRK